MLGGVVGTRSKGKLYSLNVLASTYQGKRKRNT
jgi:hypothetical protein